MARDKEKLKLWNLQNKEKTKEYHKIYRAKNTEKRRMWNREWIENNREQFTASKYKYRDKLKEFVLKHYGNGKMECSRCGIKDIDVLCIDHINNDGAEHRKRAKIGGRGGSGQWTYMALKRDGFPDGLQILCANCNLKKEIELKRKKRNENKFYNNGDTNPLQVYSSSVSAPPA